MTANELGLWMFGLHALAERAICRSQRYVFMSLNYEDNRVLPKLFPFIGTIHKLLILRTSWKASTIETYAKMLRKESSLIDDTSEEIGLMGEQLR